MKTVGIEYSVSVEFKVPSDWTTEEIQEAVDAVVLSPYFSDYDSPDIDKHSTDAGFAVEWIGVDGERLQ